MAKICRELAIPASWMRGGSSKGLFFAAEHLPEEPEERDRLLLSAIGSPDGYLKQINGLGGATSSTSKIVILSPSKRHDVDVDYLFGHVCIDQPLIDYSGNCGNLSSAVGVLPWNRVGLHHIVRVPRSGCGRSIFLSRWLFTFPVRMAVL